jgi:hypothetical protein
MAQLFLWQWGLVHVLSLAGCIPSSSCGSFCNAQWHLREEGMQRSQQTWNEREPRQGVGDAIIMEEEQIGYSENQIVQSSDNYTDVVTLKAFVVVVWLRALVVFHL